MDFLPSRFTLRAPLYTAFQPQSSEAAFCASADTPELDLFGMLLSTLLQSPTPRLPRRDTPMQSAY